MPRTHPFLRSMRIQSPKDFSRAFRGGSRARGSLLLVVAFENGTPTTRLGLSVGRVIWKSAVRRNRVRRVFREAFRLSWRELPVGFDIVLVPARPGLEPKIVETCRELVHLARKAEQRWRTKPPPPTELPTSPAAAGETSPPDAPRPQSADRARSKPASPGHSASPARAVSPTAAVSLAESASPGKSASPPEVAESPSPTKSARAAKSPRPGHPGAASEPPRDASL